MDQALREGKLIRLSRGPHWLDLHPRMVKAGRTIKAKTLVDCMRALPFDEALPIADSALRRRTSRRRVSPCWPRPSRDVAQSPPSAWPWRPPARRRTPSSRWRGPIALDIPGLHVQARFPVRVNGSLTIHPDLADPALGVAIECEGFEWHGDSAQLVRDCERYNHLVLLGWTVIRFGWVHVIEQPGYVRRVISRLVTERPLVG